MRKISKRTGLYGFLTHKNLRVKILVMPLRITALKLLKTG